MVQRSRRVSASTESLGRIFVTYHTVNFYRALLPAPLRSYTTTWSVPLLHELLVRVYVGDSFYTAVLPAPLRSYATTMSLPLCHMSYWYVLMLMYVMQMMFIIYLPFGIDVLCTGIDTGWIWLVCMVAVNVFSTCSSFCNDIPQ